MRILPVFAITLIVFPLLELYVLIKLGTLIGALPTVILVVGTAVLGSLLMRHQGWSNYQRMQQSIARGEVPAQAMLEGVAILLGALLLLLPGLITDVVGLVCLIPFFRRAIIKYLTRRMAVRMHTTSDARTSKGQIYDTKYRHISPDKDR